MKVRVRVRMRVSVSEGGESPDGGGATKRGQ